MKFLQSRAASASAGKLALQTGQRGFELFVVGGPRDAGVEPLRP
jgi:hypothetical protein